MSFLGAERDFQEAIAITRISAHKIELERGKRIREELLQKFTNEADRIFYTFEDFRSSARTLYVKNRSDILEEFLWDDTAFLFFDPSTSESVFELKSAKDFRLFGV